MLKCPAKSTVCLVDRKKRWMVIHWSSTSNSWKPCVRIWTIKEASQTLGRGTTLCRVYLATRVQRKTALIATSCMSTTLWNPSKWRVIWATKVSISWQNWLQYPIVRVACWQARSCKTTKLEARKLRHLTQQSEIGHMMISKTGKTRLSWMIAHLISEGAQLSLKEKSLLRMTIWRTLTRVRVLWHIIEETILCVSCSGLRLRCIVNQTLLWSVVTLFQTRSYLKSDQCKRISQCHLVALKTWTTKRWCWPRQTTLPQGRLS